MKVADVVQEYWNESGARLYDKIHYMNRSLLKEDLLQHLNADHESAILDFCAGSGFMTSLLVEMGFRKIIGVDINLQMLLRAKQRLAGHPVLLVRGDGLHLPLRDNSVSTVIIKSALWVMPDPGRAVREMIRVVKPGGKVIALETGRHGDKKQRFTLKRLIKDAHHSVITLMTGASPGRTKRFWKQTAGKLPMYSLDQYVQIFIQEGLENVARTEGRDYRTAWSRLFSDGSNFSMITGINPDATVQGPDRAAGDRGEVDLTGMLACPECHSRVIKTGEGLFACKGCGRSFPISEGMPDLLPAKEKLL